MPVRPTSVRYRVVAIGTVIAVLLYLDRLCLTAVHSDVRDDLGLSEPQMSFMHSAFYLTYALGQLPFGYLADRFGPRRILSSYVAIWSVLTALMGLARDFWSLLFFRLGCGLFESGAYPACSSMIRRWTPVTQRGTASGVVSLGGRIGGTVAPFLVAYMTGMFGTIAAVNAMFYGQTWRPTFIAFGLFGIVVAICFAVRYRDNPREHPGVNDAELALIEAPPPVVGETADSESITATAPPLNAASGEPLKFGELLKRILRNTDFWRLSVYQFGANFGFAFYVSLLNPYLETVHGVTDKPERGFLQSLILACALPALLVGGWLTDASTRRFGQRWGRVLPLTIPRIIAGVVFAGAYFLPPGNAWAVVVLFGFVLFCSEVCLPAIWAYCMDVGGRSTALVLGWGNMIGNLGAFASPNAVNYLERNYGWTAVWFTISAMYIGMSLLCLGIDSRNKIAD
ncbi:MAG: MFS transporter [Gemmataceae bacterium]|nr:MFS transporter [Gemmataceae bacterium]